MHQNKYRTLKKKILSITIYISCTFTEDIPCNFIPLFTITLIFEIHTE